MPPELCASEGQEQPCGGLSVRGEGGVDLREGVKGCVSTVQSSVASEVISFGSF